MPRNVGPLEDATHFGQSGCPGDGPYVQIWVQLKDGVISRAAYATHGCPSSIASASILCQLVTGRELARASCLEAEDLVTVLGGLPEGKERYAAHAIEALRNLSPTTSGAVLPCMANQTDGE
jgi:NifU-like protein involved in Fe-S cluster formation